MPVTPVESALQASRICWMAAERSMTPRLPRRAESRKLRCMRVVVTCGPSYEPIDEVRRITNFSTGDSHSFGGTYRELVPSEKIRYTDSFDDPNLPGEMQTTVTLKKVLCGTELSVEQAGVPEAIPLEMCYLGWQESLAQLARLVEPEIPA